MQRRKFLIMGATLAVSSKIWIPKAGAEELANTGSSLTSAEVEKALLLHNNARAEVGVEPLNWSNTLAEHAQGWAEKLAGGEGFNHSGGPYGENLAGEKTMEEAFDIWLSEKRSYQPGSKGKNFMKCGHYTQIIWSRSTKMGCGRAQGPTYAIWVCNYDPPGNIIGEDPY